MYARRLRRGVTGLALLPGGKEETSDGDVTLDDPAVPLATLPCCICENPEPPEHHGPCGSGGCGASEMALLYEDGSPVERRVVDGVMTYVLRPEVRSDGGGGSYYTVERHLLRVYGYHEHAPLLNPNVPIWSPAPANDDNHEVQVELCLCGLTNDSCSSCTSGPDSWLLVARDWTNAHFHQDGVWKMNPFDSDENWHGFPTRAVTPGTKYHYAVRYYGKQDIAYSSLTFYVDDVPQCGGTGQPCCSGGQCDAGLVCDLASGTCVDPEECGDYNQACCEEGDPCLPGFVCENGICTEQVLWPARTVLDSLSPASVVPGTQTRVTGSVEGDSGDGYQGLAGHPVRVYIGSGVAAEGNTDAGGSFAFDITAPTNQGVFTIKAKSLRTGQYEASPLSNALNLDVRDEGGGGPCGGTDRDCCGGGQCDDHRDTCVSGACRAVPVEVPTAITLDTSHQERAVALTVRLDATFPGGEYPAPGAAVDVLVRRIHRGGTRGDLELFDTLTLDSSGSALVEVPVPREHAGDRGLEVTAVFSTWDDGHVTYLGSQASADALIPDGGGGAAGIPVGLGLAALGLLALVYLDREGKS